MKKIRPVYNVVIVKPIKEQKFADGEFHIDEMEQIEEAEVISKGEKCKGNYKAGDTVGYVMGQRYLAGDISFIHDEDVRYVKEN